MSTLIDCPQITAIARPEQPVYFEVIPPSFKSIDAVMTPHYGRSRKQKLQVETLISVDGGKSWIFATSMEWPDCAEIKYRTVYITKPIKRRVKK